MGIPVKIAYHHVGIYVSDMDRSIEWYCRMFGFKLMQRSFQQLTPTHGEEMAFLKLGDDTYLELYVRPNAPAFDRENDYNVKLGCKHLCLAVSDEDFEAAKAYFKEQGVVFTVDVRHKPEVSGKPNGAGVVYFNDPDGVPVEVIERYTPGEY